MGNIENDVKHLELTGLYLREQNLTTSKWESICFEDCRKETRDKFIRNLHSKGKFDVLGSLVWQIAENENYDAEDCIKACDILVEILRSKL